MYKSIVNCQKCLLYKNQKPLIDKIVPADIMIVGLSAKIKKYEKEIPLDGRTRSGKIIDEFQKIAHRYNFSVYRTNIVKCVPLNEQKRIIYPNELELQSCFKNFVAEVKLVDPTIIILLGNIVRETVSQQLKIILDNPTENNLPMTRIKNRFIISSYHPAFLLRSKRRREMCYYMLNERIVQIKEKSYE